MTLVDDPYFRVELLSAMTNPQQMIWAGMHQDYSEDLVADEQDHFPDEARAGELLIKHLLQGNRGHFGPIEHPQIVFNVGFFPHSTAQQLRTHRVGISFDIQSFRYSGMRVLDVLNGKRTVEEIFLFASSWLLQRSSRQKNISIHQSNDSLIWAGA